MQLKKNLVIIGMMGSGKSTIGLILANKLNIDFIDIDSELEEQEGKKISKIFEEKGEKYFRKIEEEISIKNLNLSKKIISLGGGGFINDNIQKKVLKENISIFLNWKDTTLMERIENSKKRPLAMKSNNKELRELITFRSKIYKKANHIINCENLSKNEIVDTIIKICEK